LEAGQAREKDFMSKKVEQKVAKICYMVLFVALGLFFITPFLMSIFFAATVALALYPVLIKLESRGMGRAKASLLLTSLSTFLISVPLIFFIVKGTVAITTQLEKISTSPKLKGQDVTQLAVTFRHEIVNYIYRYTSHIKHADFLTIDKIDDYVEMVTKFLLNFFKGFAATLPEFLLLFLVMVLCLHTFLCHSQGIRDFFKNIFGFSEERMKQFVMIYIDDSRQIYISNLATGLLQATIVASTVAIAGYGEFFMVFFITLTLSFIPVIGAAPVIILFSLFAYLQGDGTTALIFLVIGCFTGIVDNILRPWLAGLGESRCPSIVSFITVLSGAILLGFPGLFIGILVGALVFDTLPLFWDELKKSDSFF
jgi:predicted PurR-regulated permease PerM